MALHRDSGPGVRAKVPCVLGRHHQRRPYRCGWEGVIAPGYAAGDLHIDQTVAQVVAAHKLAYDETECRTRDRPGDPKLAQRAIEPIDVRSLIYQLAVTYAHHLVDTVGELVTAILDMNAGVAMIDVAAVDVRIARHERSPPRLSQPVRR